MLKVIIFHSILIKKKSNYSFHVSGEEIETNNKSRNLPRDIQPMGEKSDSHSQEVWLQGNESAHRHHKLPLGHSPKQTPKHGNSLAPPRTSKQGPAPKGNRWSMSGCCQTCPSVLRWSSEPGAAVTAPRVRPKQKKIIFSQL